MGSLKYVKGEDFTDKHWIDVYNILEMPLKSLDDLKFKDFLNVSDKLSSSVKELQVGSCRNMSTNLTNML
jgi:dynein heavy chain 2